MAGDRLEDTAGVGIGIGRHFTREGVDPYEEVTWERRDSRISDHRDGSVAFEQLEVEVPSSWSVNATNILAQKYFRGTLGSAERESSLRQVVDRVVDTITRWGSADGYFADAAEAAAFSAELKHLIVNQKAAFNSPVWFNIGVAGVPQQAAACFILAVDDAMQSILNWYVEEGTIFKGGSGAGVNLSRIRGSQELLAGGGTASGPVSFMRGADASAGTIKSGGKTRRAAKMVILDADHPDVQEFIWCKAIEERKARALAEAGFDMDLDGSDSHSIQYQNANNSVRVTDEFMQAVLEDRDWDLVARTTGEVLKTVKARDLFRQVAAAAWECADPGVQYDTTINRWHTAPNTGRITASNPCSEYVHLDNSSCNLASINLLRFLTEDGRFDVDGFRQAIEVVFTAQEILVGNADYPTERIADTTRRFRQLGLGYANLGALLMAEGIPYDSDEGRAWAGAVTALLTGHAYATSARIASRMGPFAGFHQNAAPMLEVLRMHRAEVAKIDEELVPTELLSAAQESFDSAVELAEQYGVRNAQATVLAPTGTISFLMDCDTTGIEPDLGLVKTKKLVGGGTMSIVNQTVPRALRRLGYAEGQVSEIVAYVDAHKSIVGAPGLDPGHLPVFACSMGDNTIHYPGHVRMVAATQPFISGAISKCVVGSTLVPTADGLVRIGSLHEGEAPDSFSDRVIALASLEGVQKTDAFYYGGVRPVRKVVLRSGHGVTGTPNHRLLVAGDGRPDWKRLDEIVPGDRVAVQYGADLWSDVPARLHLEGLPETMTEELAFRVGLDAVRGDDGAALAPLVEAVLRSPKRMVVAFLEGVAPGIGWAAGGEPTGTIRLDSEQLLDHLQAVLTNLGVLHSRGACELRATGGSAEGILFSLVESVEDAGEQEVFDVSVPATHAFVGNGIVNHNTVNMPEEVTVEDVEALYVDAWRLGLKAVAIYRDNCKVAQPLATTKKAQAAAPAQQGPAAGAPTTGAAGAPGERELRARIAELEAALAGAASPQGRVEAPVATARQRLPRRRSSKTFAFRVADCEGYVTVGEYEDGRPGEVFMKVSKQGSTLSGVMDAFSIAVSLGLQHGVPLSTFVRKYTNMRFEPAGITDDPELRLASSLVDYIFRRLALDYLSFDERLELGVLSTGERTQPTLPGLEDVEAGDAVKREQEAFGDRGEAGEAARLARAATPTPESRDAPFCYACGNLMQRAGSCYACASCGATSGCS